MVEGSLGSKSIITKESGESRAINWGKVRTGFLEGYGCVRLATLDQEMGMEGRKQGLRTH